MRHVLADRGYRREAVIAVAYNKLAQNELETRLEALAPRTRTLNSLGYSLLARHRQNRPPVMSEPDVRRVIDEVFPIPRQRRTNTDPVGPYLDALTVVRLGLADPADVEEMRDDVPGLRRGLRRVPPAAPPASARSTSTSRSTGRSRRCCATGSSAAGCRRSTGTCSSTSSRT